MFLTIDDDGDFWYCYTDDIEKKLYRGICILFAGDETASLKHIVLYKHTVMVDYVC